MNGGFRPLPALPAILDSGRWGQNRLNYIGDLTESRPLVKPDDVALQEVLAFDSFPGIAVSKSLDDSTCRPPRIRR